MPTTALREPPEELPPRLEGSEVGRPVRRVAPFGRRRRAGRHVRVTGGPRDGVRDGPVRREPRPGRTRGVPDPRVRGGVLPRGPAVVRRADTGRDGRGVARHIREEGREGEAGGAAGAGGRPRGRPPGRRRRRREQHSAGPARARPRGEGGTRLAGLVPPLPRPVRRHAFHGVVPRRRGQDVGPPPAPPRGRPAADAPVPRRPGARLGRLGHRPPDTEGPTAVPHRPREDEGGRPPPGLGAVLAVARPPPLRGGGEPRPTPPRGGVEDGAGALPPEPRRVGRARRVPPEGPVQPLGGEGGREGEGEGGGVKESGRERRGRQGEVFSRAEPGQAIVELS
ncbi:hypothetical protein THAOC_21071 [Thalassiosira oceanica]|uniref:Uncharacterized protein n=1 Tax=Thalassiosira oceanica TaxID=159749 RepID=K0S0E9_THAOC|nr:hypothetical protein THAOC_21071 [Thalassiosira oceanica]|eukprot:EJK58775.1 hypothetical protein THAOC_21071 [Thalassiosira oceanica]